MARRPERGQRCRKLQQQSRFADARLACDQQHRPWHDAAAGNAVELRHAGREARRFFWCARKPFEYDGLAARGFLQAAAGRRDGRRLLDDGVPLPQDAHLLAQRGDTAPQF